MTMLLRRISAAALLLLGASTAGADNLALFNAAIEDVESHNRAALGLLQDKTHEHMKEAWSAFAERFSGTSLPRGGLD
jgi:hypothetical protein